MPSNEEIAKSMQYSVMQKAPKLISNNFKKFLYRKKQNSNETLENKPYFVSYYNKNSE